MENKRNIILFTGKTVSLKTTTITALMKILSEVGTIRATTTRGFRVDDPPTEYEYVSYVKFCLDLLSGEYFSWRKNSKDDKRTDDLYAVSKKRFKEAMESDQVFLRSLTPDTIELWHSFAADNVILIHLTAPDENESRRRMVKRGGMTPEQIEQRLVDEKDWDDEIVELIKKGLPIHVIPCLEGAEMLHRTLEILRSYGLNC